MGIILNGVLGLTAAVGLGSFRESVIAQSGENSLDKPFRYAVEMDNHHLSNQYPAMWWKTQ